MTDVIIIAVIWAIMFIVAFVFIPLWRRHHDAESGLYARTQEDNKLSVDHALKKLNCKAKWERNQEEIMAHYDYQSGHFRIRLEKTSPYVRLIYLFFFDTDLDNIELVRNVCNQCNLNTETCRLVYSVNETKGTVDVHIVNALLLNDSNAQEVIERAMQNIFRWQRIFMMRFKALKETSDRAINRDAEKRDAAWKRELFLIRELEMTHQEDGPEWHGNPQSPILLRQLLASAMGLTDIVPARLTMTCDGKAEVLEDADTILDYDISKPLIQGDKFIHLSAVALLTYYDPRDPVKQRQLTLCFEQEEQTDDTLYYRITLALSPVSMTGDTGTNEIQRRKLMSSVLLGHDLTSAEKRLAEFRYVWKEARAKMQNGQTDDLTDEERMLCNLQDPHHGQALLRGKALFEQKRFYESVLILENVFYHLQSSFTKMGVSAREAFIELCYLIGSCYTHLHQYCRAGYYLQLTLPAHRITYMQTFVNCLVNGRDFRAMLFIDSFLQELQPIVGENQQEETTGEMYEIIAFIGFLKRRKAYLLVSAERYDEAERLLKQLLDDPANSDYALKELAYIQKKKQK
ncbi:MAG: hypothetical protein ACOYJK_01195 [Prevotella sp.]|jgi:hypothetical protein